MATYQQVGQSIGNTAKSLAPTGNNLLQMLLSVANSVWLHGF